MSHWYKQYLNRFLNNKSDFTNNEKLKSLNEQYFYLLNEAKKLLNHIIKENIKYYFTYKKVYLTKLLIVNSIRLSIVIGVVFGIFWSLNYFHIMDISKSKPVVTEKVTIYLPDYDTINQVKLEKTFNVVIFFLPDARKDWKLYKKSIHNIETRGTTDAQSYYTLSANKEYWGRYQLGSTARKIGKAESYTWEAFSKNPDAQEAAFLEWVKFIKRSMQPEINRYSGRFMDGVQITESGIISMSHNAGIEPVRAYLQRGGGNPPGGLKFIKLGGYNLNLE